jgi:hypothetical protein
MSVLIETSRDISIVCSCVFALIDIKNAMESLLSIRQLKNEI